MPLLVGGTMLYLRALIGGLAHLPEASADIRARLDSQAAREGWPALHARLAAVDAQAAARIHHNDAQRIQRALEVYEVSGEPISALQARTRAPLARDFRVVALMPTDRVRLHDDLARRLDQMMAAGFLGEVRRLQERGDLTDSHPAVRAVRLPATLVAPGRGLPTVGRGGTRRGRHTSTGQKTDDMVAFHAKHPFVRSL